MFDDLSVKVQQLTNQAAEFVATLKIEECQDLIKERQILLQKLSDFVLKEDDVSLKNQLSELLIWIQNKDAIALKDCFKFKNDYRDKLVTQSKVSKAMQEYKKY